MKSCYFLLFKCKEDTRNVLFSPFVDLGKFVFKPESSKLWGPADVVLDSDGDMVDVDVDDDVDVDADAGNPFWRVGPNNLRRICASVLG